MWSTEPLKITIPDFAQGEYIPEKFSTYGKDVNPEILISGSVPYKTKSFVFCVADPDAPNGTWYHWLLQDIPPTINKIQENSICGKQIRNSWNIKNYKGPRPPSGTHRYYFTLYALDIETFKANNQYDFLSSIKGHVLAEASYIGKFASRIIR